MFFFFQKLSLLLSQTLATLGSLDGATFYKPRLVFGCDGWRRVRRVLGHLHVADADVGVPTNAAYVASLGSEQLCHGVLASPKKTAVPGILLRSEKCAICGWYIDTFLVFVQVKSPYYMIDIHG